MALRLLKELWEFLCILVLGVPMMIVGYFGTFMVNGLATGNRLYSALHGPEVDTIPDSDKTSP